ncbi:MAG: PKD domain-containing protein [Methanomassiliicoccales archaeon]|nr:PKD domain-containing protein [Methanomassiliicoccales archaeon]
MNAPSRVHSVALIILVILLMTPAFSSPAASVDGTSSISYDYHYGRTVVDMSSSQRLFLVGDLELDTTPGAPVLPVETLMLAVPPGQRLIDVKAWHSEPKLVEMIDSYPCNSAVAPLGGGECVTEYQDQGAWVYAGSYILEGVEVACINLRPLCWDVSTGRVDLTTDYKITLLTEPEAPGYIGDLDRVRELVDNADAVPEMARTVVSDVLPTESYQYLIITDVSLSTPFQALADWKAERNEQGSIYGNLDSTIVTLQDIMTYSALWGVPASHGGTGNDTQTLIRNFIRAAHEEWGVSYVLIGGDDDVVPCRKVWVNAGANSDQLPADIYFTGLDGDWDDDGDGIYGEPSDVGAQGEEADLLAEVYVGRATVSNVNDAWNFVNKTIQYEKGYVGQYGDDLLFVGEQLSSDPMTWGGDYKNQVYNLVLRDEGLDLTTIYEKDGTFSKAVFLQRMGSGVHLINHMGHGNYETFADLSIDDVKGLHNDLPFILYTQACMVAGFDEKSDYPGDCIAEEFIKGEGGAVAFIGNSRYGWYAPGSTDGSSQKFDISFFSQIFDDDVRQLGRALSWSKEENVNYATTPGTVRWVYMELNLLGDPETMVLTTSPGEHDLSVRRLVVDQSVLNEVGRASVQVQNLGQFSENGTVRLLVDDVLVSSSSVNLVPGESAWADLNWTPSEYRPHELRVEVNCAIDNIASNNAIDLTVIVDRRLTADELWEGENRSLPGGIIVDPGVTLEVHDCVVTFSPLPIDYLVDVKGTMRANGTTFGGSPFSITSTGVLDLVDCHLIDMSEREASCFSGGDLTISNSSIQGGMGWQLNTTDLRIEGSTLIDQTSEWTVTRSSIDLDGSDGYGGGLRLSNVSGSLRNVTWSGAQRGLIVEWSSNLLMHDLYLSGNGVDIDIVGDDATHFLHDLNNVNLTNGQLVIMDQAHDITVEGGIGSLYLVNCDNVTVKNWSLNHAGNGLGLISSTGTIVVGNAIENCSTGVLALNSDGVMWSNDLIGNERQVRQISSHLTFGLTYPTGGNHWSDLIAVDVMSGPGQDQEGSDGMADQAYVNDDVLDQYPKVGRCSIVHDAPVANFTMDTAVLDIISTVTFTDTSESGSGIGNWTWDLGDGTVTYGRQVSHLYSTKGPVTISLTVTDHKGSIDLKSIDLEVVNHPPECDLSFSPLQPAPGELVSFMDRSLDVDGGIVSRWWYLGDEYLSNGTSFEHAFPNAGDYYVNLTVMDAEGGSDSCVRKVAVGNSAPVSDFSWTPSYITSLQTVDFSTNCIDTDGHIVSWSWDFGDGTSGSGIAVAHRFARTGTYLVRLTVTDDDGATGTSSISLMVNNARPTASFECQEQVVSMVDVYFKDRSFDPDGTIRSWSWDFGDGSTSTTTSPSHAFRGPGVYSITLTVKDDLGSMGTSTKIVTVTNRPPQASIVAPEGTYHSLDTVELIGQGTDVDGEVVDYLWELGDGGTGSGEVLRYAYSAPGEYTVTLTLIDDAGGSSKASMILVILNLAPEVDIVVEQGPDHPRELRFVAEALDSDGTVVHYNWSFGDGSFGQNGSCLHRYAEDGEYLVELTVVDDQGCQSNATTSITVWTGDLSMENVTCVHRDDGWVLRAELLNDGPIPVNVTLMVDVSGTNISTEYHLDAGERRVVDLFLGEFEEAEVTATLVLPTGWYANADDSSWTGSLVRNDDGAPWPFMIGLVLLALVMIVAVVVIRRR